MFTSIGLRVAIVMWMLPTLVVTSSATEADEYQVKGGSSHRTLKRSPPLTPEELHAVFREATTAAKSIDDAWRRSKNLSRIAEIESRLGDRDRTRNACKATLIAIKEVKEPHLRAGFLEEVARAEAASGDAVAARTHFVLAVETIDATVFPCEVAERLVGLAEFELIQGRSDQAAAAFQRAVSLVKHATSTQDRHLTLRYIAMRQAHQGDWSMAVKTALLADTPYEKGLTLAIVSSVLARQDIPQSKRVWQMSARISAEAGMTDDVLQELAISAALRGDFTKAFEFASRIRFPHCSVLAYDGIAKHQMALGKRSEAVKTVQLAQAAMRKITDLDLRVWACEDLAVLQALTGNLQDALHTVSELKLGDAELEVVPKVKTYLAGGDFCNALRAARSIDCDYKRCEALIEVAQSAVDLRLKLNPSSESSRADNRKNDGKTQGEKRIEYEVR